MTKPTQAQIEAAAESLYGPSWRDFKDCYEAAEAALTAAAAAELEQETIGLDGLTNSERFCLPVARQAAADAIERCAQIAREYDGYDPEGARLRIAENILTLKDKPIDPNIIYPGKDLTNVFPEET